MLQCTVMVAVGANLPGPGGRAALDTCRWAVAEMERCPGLHVLACSKWYRSAPVPRSDQPDYVNGVVRGTTTLDPEALLDALQAIEAAAGRVRGAVNAARTLDLDLLVANDLVCRTPRLTLPHPRLAERAFVLLPFNDVAPGWVLPGGQRIGTLAASADREGIAVMAEV